MLHAYLGHGESDKAASASNQVKAYDFVLLPGEAGQGTVAPQPAALRRRRARRLVGRPQLDGAATRPTAADRGRRRPRPTVLYAPTWEGAQPSMAYSSVVSHGEPLLRSLLESGGTASCTARTRAPARMTRPVRPADAALRALVLSHSRRREPESARGRHRAGVGRAARARRPADQRHLGGGQRLDDHGQADRRHGARRRCRVRRRRTACSTRCPASRPPTRPGPPSWCADASWASGRLAGGGPRGCGATMGDTAPGAATRGSLRCATSSSQLRAASSPRAPGGGART